MQENLNLISQHAESHQNEIHLIKWKSLLWMLLGWAISWEFSWGIGSSIDNFLMGGLIGGAGAGASIAWVLRNESIIKRTISYLFLVIGWSIGGGISLLFYKVIDITFIGSLCGLIGGITMTSVLWKENILSNKLSIIVISLGWVLGLTIGWGISSSKFIVQFALIWLFVGVMMTWILSPHIKVENQIRAFFWIIFGWLTGGVLCYLEIERGMDYIDSIIVDDIGGIMMGMFVFLWGLGIGILVGIIITVLVLIKEKPLDYAKVFLRILLGLIGIGFIVWIVSWALSELPIRLSYFAINSVIGAVIGWRSMIWILRINIIRK